MKMNERTRLLFGAIVFAVSGVSFAEIADAPLKKREPKDARILVSGALSGRREARGVLDPTGGSIGVVRLLNQKDGNRAAIRLAIGDNLGSALRPANSSSVAFLRLVSTLPPTPDTDIPAPSAPVPETQEDPCRNAMANGYEAFTKNPSQEAAKHLADSAGDFCGLSPIEQYDAIRLGQLMLGYRDSSLSPKACLGALEQYPKTAVTMSERLDECENELLAGELRSNFTAVAIGEGDFNRFGADKDVSALRRGPFIAANVFVAKAGGLSELEQKDRAIRILIDKKDKRHFPSQPIQVEFRDKAVRKELESIELSSENWRVLYVFKETPGTGAHQSKVHEPTTVEEESSNKLFAVWRDDSGSERVFQADWDNAFKEKENTVSLSSPIPLLSGRTYTLKFAIYRSDSIELRFETYEAFTYSRKGEPVTEELGTNVGDRSDNANLKPLGAWVADSVPIVAPSGFEEELRVTAVLDKEIDQKRDRSVCESSRSHEILACDLRFVEMNEAVRYWRQVLAWLLFRERVAKLAFLAGNCYRGAPDGLLDVLNERRRLGANLPPKESDAWAVIEGKCNAKGDIYACALDRRIPAIRAALEASKPGPALVLLAQASRDKVISLTDEFPDLAILVGREVPEKAKRQTATSWGGISGPVLLFPADNGEKLQELHVTLRAASPWRIVKADLSEEPVPGQPPRLLWGFPVEGAEPCCDKPFMEVIGRLLGTNPKTGEVVAEFEKARDHFLKSMALQMRVDSSAETSLLKPGSFDLAPLEWLALLGRIADGKKIELQSGTLDELSKIPGVGDLARELKLECVHTLDHLQNFLVRHGRPHAFEWVKHFVSDSKTKVSTPYVLPSRLLESLERRIVLTQDDLEKVTVPGAQFVKAVVSHKDFPESGFKRGQQDKVFLHGLEITPSTPVTVALAARSAQKNGEFAELTAAAIQRETISTTSREGDPDKRPRDATLKTALENLINGKEGGAPPTTANYDQRSWWMVSMKQLDFDYRRVVVKDGFTPIAGDPRTKSTDGRSVSIKPQLEVGWFLPPGRLGANGSLDWKNTFSSKYERERIDDDKDFTTNERIANSFINPVEDEWKIRSQLDFFPWNRNLAFYTAGEYVGQFSQRYGSVNIRNQDYFLPQLKKREFNLEWGFFLTDAKQDINVRIGFKRNRNLNWLREISYTGNQGVPVTVSPTGLGTALDDLDPDEIPQMNSLLDVDLIQDKITQNGLTFSGEWSHDLHKWEEDGRKLKISLKVTDGDFFARPSQGNSSLPRFRMLLDGRLTIPLFGNLAVAPGVESFVLYLQEQPDTGNRLFVRWIPSFKITYSFDVKPLFQEFWRGLVFKNKP